MPILHRLVTTFIFVVICNALTVQANVKVTVTQPQIEKNFSDTIKTIGSSIAPDNVMVASMVTEIISDIHFKSGQQVKKGDLLITLSHKEIDTEISILKRQIKNQNKELNRLKKLKTAGHIQQQNIDTLQTQVDISQQHLLKQEIILQHHYIRAPFDGLLGLRTVSEGQLINAGDTVVSIVHFDPMYIDFTLPASNLPLLKLGSIITVSDTQLVNTPATIIAFDNHIDPNTRSIKIRSSIENTQGNIFSGQLFRINIHTHAREALVVPEKALLQRGSQHFLFVVSNGIARQVTVKIGTRKAGFIEITEGISTSDHIVSDGLLWLKDGSAVEVIPSNTTNKVDNH